LDEVVMAEDDANRSKSGRERCLVGLFVLALVAGACSEEPETPVAASELQELEADQAVFGMRMYITVEGIREALLYADTAYTYRDSVEIDVRSLQLTLYGETGNERAFVTANRGAVDPNTQRMQARGNVVLTIPEQNRRIESSQLNYDPNRDRIWSDTATVMIHDGRRSTGDAFESDLDFTSVRIFGARGRSGNGGP
jgi:LPS export ABC transporter protein LptC